MGIGLSNQTWEKYMYLYMWTHALLSEVKHPDNNKATCITPGEGASLNRNVSIDINAQ